MMPEPTSNLEWLTMTNAENYSAIMAAWMNPGPHPEYHRAMQAEVHRTMPVLAATLERAARDAARRRGATERTYTREDMARAWGEGYDEACLDGILGEQETNPYIQQEEA